VEQIAEDRMLALHIPEHKEVPLFKIRGNVCAHKKMSFFSKRQLHTVLYLHGFLLAIIFCI